MPSDMHEPEWQILDVLKQVLSELQALRGLFDKKQAPSSKDLAQGLADELRRTSVTIR